MKKTKIKKWCGLWLAVLLIFLLTACGSAQGQDTEVSVPDTAGTQEVIPEEADSDISDNLEEAEEADQDIPGDTEEPVLEDQEEPESLPEDGIYTSKEEVAEYIYLYGHLPENFITKKEAQSLGWEGGSLEPFAPDKCIGGSRFGNYEGLLPEKEGRTYTECDIDTLGTDRRGAKRIVFSNDGLIYYTEDHYETFELLYGEEQL